MPKTYTPEVHVMDDRGAFLIGRDRNVYSQFGEDGLIEAVFENVGIENRWCFECGASDGMRYSNTKVLREAGWSAVLIENDERVQDDLTKCVSYEKRSIVRFDTINERRTLDMVLSSVAAVPSDMDLGIIDIDGQDYWAWLDMVDYMPRVMVVEYAHRVMLNKPPDRGGGGQAGGDSIVDLGREKGYVALARTPCNLLFVLSGLV